jgi:hypothetical protein
MVSSMRFVPYDALGDQPNVIVDGAASSATVLTLSHWPGSTVAVPLRADLSAEIAIRYLERPDHHVDAELVSNNHFDEDGLLGLYALLAPDQALAQRDLVVDVARAGDFAWSRSRHAARVAFAVSALVEPTTSTLDPAVFSGDYPTMAAALYHELLPMVPELLTDIDRFHDLWAEEDAHLTESETQFGRGEVTIAEHPDVDLAIVTVPERVPDRVVHRFTQRRHAGVHPMAVHNRTDMTRVLYIAAQQYQVQLRYETWVQLVSRRPPPRVDLGLFAARCNEMESSGGTWQFDGASAITPALSLRDASESTIEPDRFTAELLDFLRDAEPAWDPWAPR